MTHPVVAGELATNCPLCLNPNCDTKFIPCGHLAHWNCQGQDAILNLSACPLCRQQITDFYTIDGAQQNWEYNG